MANLLNSSDLKYDYSKSATTGDNPELIGTPDKDLFNRNEEYEVLNLINSFAEKHNLKNIASGQKAEKMLQDLPSDIRNREKVITWLEENWDKY